MSSTSSATDPERQALHSALGAELYAAWRARCVVPPLRHRNLGLTINDAYSISHAFLQNRVRSGARVIGAKIGVTSSAVQEMLGVHQPDFGFLTDDMLVADGATIDVRTQLIQPRAEAEIALQLRTSLHGPGVTPIEVLAATDCVMPCFEIVDSRIAGWDIGIVDTVADNASCGFFVLGTARASPHQLDLAALRVRVRKNGNPSSEGIGSAVQGTPLASVAWLANTLGAYGVALKAGDIVLSGSLVPLEPATPGDRFHAEFENMGCVSVSFS